MGGRVTTPTITEREAVERERAAFLAGCAAAAAVVYPTSAGDAAKMVAASWPVRAADHWADDETIAYAEGAAAARYPLPKVTRPRVVQDTTRIEYRLAPETADCYAAIEYRSAPGLAWRVVSDVAATAERVRLWADLLANPTEEVSE